MQKFFLPPGQAVGSFLTLDGENAAHAKVLRLRCGDEVVVCDGSGTDYFCTISDIHPEQVSLVVHSGSPASSEPPVFCSVYMAFAKGDKFEHVVQKATELGAAEIVVFPSAHCVSKPDEKSLGKKLERWQKIALSAAGQSGRGRIPQVLALGSFEEAVKRASMADLALFPYENEHTRPLRTCLESAANVTSVSIMTGPEGGFSDSEVSLAEASGMRVCTLGPRILRCETAPLCALSAVLYAFGGLD